MEDVIRLGSRYFSRSRTIFPSWIRWKWWNISCWCWKLAYIYYNQYVVWGA